MTAKSLLVRSVLVASAAWAPLAATTPLFTDGPSFGGSKVFSEGTNPLGNPARYSLAPSSYGFTFVDGDLRAQDNKSILSSASSPDPAAASAALAQLADAPWAQRDRAYGLAGFKEGTCLALTQETLNGMLAYPDLAPADLGGGLANNLSTLDGRQARVNRLNIGAGAPLSKGDTTSLGVDLRVERWSRGQVVESYNSAFGRQPYFADAEPVLMGSHATSLRTWNFGLDAGAVLELAPGVRLGLTGDQLVAKHLWDVSLQPQFRAGLQLDLTPSASLSLEGDLNAAERMPLPAKQQSVSASLRYALSTSAVVLLGAERTKVDSASVTRGGVTLQIRTQAVLFAVGFQAGEDRPLKSATLMVSN